MAWLVNHLLELTGVRTGSSMAYNFWSGIGSDLAYIGAVSVALRHINCHTKGCWRRGAHGYEMDGVTYKLCARHHPAVDGQLTRSAILEHFKKRQQVD